MKKSILGLFILIIGIGVSGCHMKDNHNELPESIANIEIELTERQKEILKEEGLSTNINELTQSQIKSITAIEEMLTYLEDKYDENFKYVGYIPAGNLEKETLRACVSTGDPQVDSFDVTKTQNGYEDNYMLVAIRDDYAKYVQDVMISTLNTEKVKVFADIYTTELIDVPRKGEDYNGNVSSWKVIFVYLPENEKQISDCSELIEQVLVTRKLPYDCDVIYLKDDVIDDITKYNYTDYLSSDYYIERYTIKIE